MVGRSKAVIPFFISALVLAGAFAVSWWARRQSNRLQSLSLAATVPVAELTQDAGSVASELGAGSFRQDVKLRGHIVCDSPLVAELSHTACVSYRFSVTREYEEVLWEKDARGNSVQRIHRKSEVVASHETSTAFWLDDGTGRILVHPDQAKVERIKSHSSFQPAATFHTGVGVGSFVLNRVHPGGTIGYRYEEECLPVGQEITVVAEAGDEGGELALRKPEASHADFLVTPRSFRELADRGKTLVAVLQGVSVGLAAVAVMIFLLGVVR